MLNNHKRGSKKSFGKDKGLVLRCRNCGIFDNCVLFCQHIVGSYVKCKHFISWLISGGS